MKPYELMAEASRLAREAVVNNWGGPFGAVVARNGEVVSRGQNRVLLTGDVTAHAEIEAIRKAVEVLNPFAPSISTERQQLSTLQLSPTGDEDGVPARARMLMGMEIYSSGQPCPMCMAAIYWARLDACYFSSGIELARDAGFDDAFLYEELHRPVGERRLPIQQIFPELGEEAFKIWIRKDDRHYY